MNLINKKNLFWNSGTYIIISILGFVSFSLNLKTYDSEVFGYYLLLSAYWSIGASIDFGFSVSTIKNISESLKIGDYEKIKKIVNTFLIVYLSIGLLISLVMLALFHFYNEQISQNVVGGYNNDLLMVLLSIAFLTKYTSGFLVTVYEGLGIFVEVSQINLSITIFNTILTVIIYIFRLSLYYLVISQVLYGICLLLILFLFLVFRNNKVNFAIKYFDFHLLRQQGLYNLNIQISFILGSLVDPIMKSILTYSLGLQFVTYFETAKKLINLSNGLINSALKGLLNKLSEANAVGELKHFVNNHIYVYSNLSLDYSLIAYSILNPFICVFILIWFKSTESMIIFLLFLIPYTLINFGGPLYAVLMIKGKGGRLVIMQFINVLVVSVILFLSINILDSYLGIIGYYLATIVNIFILFYFLEKYVGFSPTLFKTKIKINNLISINILLILQIFFILLFSNYTYAILLIFFFIYLVVYRYQLKLYVGYIYGKLKNILIIG